MSLCIFSYQVRILCDAAVTRKPIANHYGERGQSPRVTCV